MPLVNQGQEKSVVGYFIAGTNPYRLLDTQYRGFLELVAGQIAAALANARAYEQERRRAEALAELDRAKTAFFSNVSHEFRTPLTLLLGPLEELIASGMRDEAAARSKLELAQRNGFRLLRLVNTLLDFSRIEAGRVQASYEPTDVAAFTAEVASTFRSAVEKAGLRLTIVPRELPHLVFLDRDMWEKVVLNLLSNAFKFTLDGEIAVSIAPSASGGAEVTVSDTGSGIPQDELPRVFDRFYRVAGARGRSFEGSGIGLALVHELVKLHGGTIDVESELGRGTTFRIELPFGSSHLPPHQVSSSASTSVPIKAESYVEEALRWLPDLEEDVRSEAVVADSERTRSALSGRGKRIVLADDNADMREYVRRLLHSSGYEVDAVENGRLAVEAARRAKTDLILSDVMMPQLDGFGLLAEIRRDPQLAGIPVVMLSAHAGEEAKIEGLDAGADDYLVKPFIARELLARVNSNIQMAHVRREAARAVMQSEQQFLMTQERLTLALSTGRVAVYDWDVDTDRLAIQGPLAEVFGVDVQDAVAGLPLESFLAGIHPEDRARAAEFVARTVSTGEPFEAEYRTCGAGGIRDVLSRGQIRTQPNGQRVFSGVLIDLTHEREAEKVLREQTRTLKILNRIAGALSSDFDLDRISQALVDAATQLSGATRGAFAYCAHDGSSGDAIRYVYSPTQNAEQHLSLPRSMREMEGMLGEVDGPTQISGASESGGCFAVPVKSHGGEVLGGLFLAYTDALSHRELLVGLAAQAAVAIDNVHLFQSAQREVQQRRRAEAELQAINATLEERVAEEVGERFKAEEALRQAQKMEAIGQLTGGVAHDFNNLLTVIIGGLDTIRRSHPEDEARIKRAADMALQGAQRAASLTGRLLAFSRRQPLDPKPLDINVLVRDMTDLLHRTLGETIELEGVLAPRLWRVEVDQNQLESAILNLAVNARDAMPEGGKLTIETANTALDQGYTETDAEVIPGQYVMVAVSDSGHGMSSEVLARAFEPFYTTKGTGRGTGLGLSMVYGFVKQSGGHVTIYSEEGHGTTVKMYFARYTGESEPLSRKIATPIPRASRGEVVLVVEDNEDVRDYSVMILRELGYQVLEAAEADAALQIVEQVPRLDLLFTDVILPGKNGRVLADAAQAKRPGLPVLYTTGYSRNAIVHHGRLDPGVSLISKPFTFEELAVRVRDVLDARRPHVK